MDGCCSGTRIFVHLCCLISLLLTSAFGTHCIPSEREALLRIKHRLKDPSNRLSSWHNASNPNCCLWPAVLCSNLTSHVLQLHLNTPEPNYDDYDTSIEYQEAHDAYLKSRFGGEVDDSLVELKHLNHLDLSHNDFEGTQIPSFLCQITSLTYLSLSHAGFHGKIPHQIGNLSNLLYLDLSFTATGSIPYQIGNLTKLLHLNLAYMVAENLHWLSGLSSLQYLDLSSATLSKSSDWLQYVQALPSLEELHLLGCILDDYNQPESTHNFSSLHSLSISIAPKWIFGLTRLVSFQLSWSYYPFLFDSIPDHIQNLTMLENLDLSWNLFTSSIPYWLYGLHYLKFLNLQGNNLGGTISNSVENLTSLVSLDLSSNQLEGKIPTSLKNLTSLVSLDFSYNKLEGNIPNSLGNLCNLEKLFFSNLKSNQQISEIIEILTPCVSHGLKILEASSSQISGHLTDQLGMFKSLVVLDLFNNSITGTLPPSLRKLSSIKILVLSKNKLNGLPFQILGSIEKLRSLSIDDNLFQGVVEEDDLANLTNLEELYASNNNLTLEVNPNWQPRFQLYILAMTSWQLGPSFPSWIQSQKNLQKLDISNTGISDSIPTWFWKHFPRAYYLNLSHNHINGELPNTLENIGYMEVIDLSSNRLHGQLPYFPIYLGWLDLSHNSFSGSVTNLLCRKGEETKLLQLLNLASNNLSGEIPDCWEMWPNLVDVNLQRNYFIGNLPSSMGSLTQLQSLHFGSNKLSGEFPLILKNTTELILLDLGENNLTGVIPSWVGERLANLKILRLRSNQFSGKLPNKICDMKFLQDLNLAQNRLSGNIPKCVNHLSAMLLNTSRVEYSFIREQINAMESSFVSVVVWVKGIGIEYQNILGLVKNIDLSDNKLSGEIPKEITKLSGVVFLNLSKNLLSGNIPQSLGNMRSLESIDFSSNQLSGEIPPTITNLSFLSKLDLSYNHLMGKIPTGTQLQSFEPSAFVGNDLCGPPVLVNCSLDGKVPDADHSDRKHKKHGLNWFFVSMAFGFIVGFWGVVLPLFTCTSWRYAYFRFLDDIWYKLQSFW